MFRIFVFGLALLMPLATAQTDDEACTQADPCPWVVQVDAEGFFDDGLDGVPFNGTVGDWHYFEILNADDADHTLTWSAYGLSWTVPSAEVTLETQAFELTREGDFRLEDAPSGDAAMIHVSIGDIVDEAAGGDGPEKTQPSAGVAVLGLALLALAGVLRR